MVFFLPMEFRVPTDEDSEGPVMAQLILILVQAMFDKPEEREHRHLRPLHIQGHVDGRPMNKMMVDGRATINVMPYIMYQKLVSGEENLIRTDMMLKDFEGKTSPAWGVISIELTIGSKTLHTTFYVINDKGS